MSAEESGTLRSRPSRLLAERLAERLAAGPGPVRVAGGRTKLGWTANGTAAEVSTAGLDRIVEHNVGDLTAVLEAGVPLAAAQRAFARERQMLALDPPDPGGATIGGVVAAADSGPLRARYGAARDLVVGMTVALSDGSVARSGGKVIKNVAGYDLPKLFAGSLGSLGAIAEVTVRLHPRPQATATAGGATRDPATLARAALELSHAPLEALALDLHWSDGSGALLARFGGVEPRAQAERAARAMRDAGLGGELREDDDEVWSAQRDGQRSRSGTVVRVSGLPTGVDTALGAAQRLGARLVGRAGLGLLWLTLDDRGPAEVVANLQALRQELAPSPCVVLDAPPEVRELVGRWPAPAPATRELMRRVKQRFDPDGRLVEPWA